MHKIVLNLANPKFKKTPETKIIATSLRNSLNLTHFEERFASKFFFKISLKCFYSTTEKNRKFHIEIFIERSSFLYLFDS